MLLGSLVLARMFGDPLQDALLMKSRFGMPFPDNGIHGYGWGLVFGYALVFAGIASFALGSIGTAVRLLQRVPKAKDRLSDSNS